MASSSVIRCCLEAAGSNRLDMLKWMRANDFEWDCATTEMAAGCGHYAVLKWARENGAPWCTATKADAALLRYVEEPSLGNEFPSLWSEFEAFEAHFLEAEALELRGSRRREGLH